MATTSVPQEAGSWGKTLWASLKSGLGRTAMAISIVVGSLLAILVMAFTFVGLDAQNRAQDIETYRVVSLKLAQQMYCVQVANMLIADFNSSRVRDEGLEYQGKWYKVLKSYSVYDQVGRLSEEYLYCQKLAPGSNALLLEPWVKQ